MAGPVTTGRGSFVMLKAIAAAALVVVFGPGLLYNFLLLSLSFLLAIGLAGSVPSRWSPPTPEYQYP